jgi:hypothetical protein
MGLSASQSRSLLLTARKCDLEFQGQQINQRRIILSNELAVAAQKYSDALANTIIEIDNGDDFEKITQNNLALAPNNFVLCDRAGKKVTGTVSADALELGLKTGGYCLKRDNDGDGTAERVNWATQPDIKERLYNEDDAAATALYEFQTSQIQSKDQKMEVELKNLDTQRSAMDTELDAVKKVIDKNIERSFKTFA